MSANRLEESYAQHQVSELQGAWGQGGRWKAWMVKIGALGMVVGFAGVADARLIPTTDPTGPAIDVRSADTDDDDYDDEEWLRILEDLLCYLYILHGGDCRDFDDLELDGTYGGLATAILLNGSGGSPSPEIIATSLEIESVVAANASQIDAQWGVGLAADYRRLMEVARFEIP